MGALFIRAEESLRAKKARWGRAKELLSHVGIANAPILHVKKP